MTEAAVGWFHTAAFIWGIGFIGSTAVAAAAYKLKSLSGSGALSAGVMGTVYVGLGGPVWFGLLLAFFISSSLLSKWKRRHRQKASAEARYAKSGRRDAGQVWANGGLGLLLCIAYAIMPHPALLYGFVGVMASVNADTWATEIGALSRSTPRSIISWRKVASGTSGGITMLGSAAAAAGALFIGLVGILLLAVTSTYSTTTENTEMAASWALLLAAVIAGLAGAFMDSVLGATVQAMYRSADGAETERATQSGLPTKHIRGLTWMTNDAVNLFSSLFAGFVAATVGHLLH